MKLQCTKKLKFSYARRRCQLDHGCSDFSIDRLPKRLRTLLSLRPILWTIHDPFARRSLLKHCWKVARHITDITRCFHVRRKRYFWRNDRNVLLPRILIFKDHICNRSRCHSSLWFAISWRFHPFKRRLSDFQTSIFVSDSNQKSISKGAENFDLLINMIPRSGKNSFIFLFLYSFFEETMHFHSTFSIEFPRLSTRGIVFHYLHLQCRWGSALLPQILP